MKRQNFFDSTNIFLVRIKIKIVIHKYFAITYNYPSKCFSYSKERNIAIASSPPASLSIMNLGLSALEGTPSTGFHTTLVIYINKVNSFVTSQTQSFIRLQSNHLLITTNTIKTKTYQEIHNINNKNVYKVRIMMRRL
ncbi:unnamed protein product [Chrysodeixis includens]|uniref:Uncharacterized protein n=1 Tax=Chrysodeixis includens TaxID=689277 RepID=A0A9N8KRY1_CHRIL|nr:unnamed protein product [Chrysodeixis includens]